MHAHKLQVQKIEPLTYTMINQTLTNGVNFQKVTNFVKFLI
jgi:hypothetical protein